VEPATAGEVGVILEKKTEKRLGADKKKRKEFFNKLDKLEGGRTLTRGSRKRCEVKKKLRLGREMIPEKKM